MIRIAITVEAFEALAASLPPPLGSVGFEREPDARGRCLIWVEENAAYRLAALRGAGESYSDVILRLIEVEGKRGGHGD
jgi:hypothetical protein